MDGLGRVRCKGRDKSRDKTVSLCTFATDFAGLYVIQGEMGQRTSAFSHGFDLGSSCVASLVLIEMNATQSLNQCVHLTEEALAIVARTYAIEFFSIAALPPGVSNIDRYTGEEEGRPVGYSHMESSRRRASGTLDHSGNLSNQQTSSFNRESMMPSSSMFAQSAGSSRRVAAVSSRDNLLSGEEFQRSHRTGDVSRGGVISRNSPVEAGKRSSSSRRHYESAIKGIDNLQVSSDDKFHHHH
ncbi:hypothetical protein F2Q68_00030194 [Brassica cretica]|uniref:Uncharacterized protein n=1 Tax=Brassica cretica TaxID=69181 RepID=A0A8S9GF50_BRACR|nr:hypothetical protein F2Q68_00030194 [Brassica cretica]